MKFQIVSDLHIDNHYYTSFPVVEKKLIIAGDLGKIGDGVLYSQCIDLLCNLFELVILIPGNHEFINIEYSKVKEYFCILQNKHRNLKVLDNEFFIIEDLMIFGSNFWSHILMDPNYPIYVNGMKIDRFSWNHNHHNSVMALEGAIKHAKDHMKKLLVVTHYSPLGLESVHPKHRDPNNYHKNLFYINDTILKDDPYIVKWIYGHTGYNYRTEKFITNQIVSGGKLDFSVEI